MSVLSEPYFHDEAAAHEFVEARVWPQSPVCPHCGGVERIGKMQGKSTRLGVYKCYQCRKRFTVKVGTVFEASHVQMHYWLQAIYLMCASKKGISSNQLHRTLGVTLKTAWFMEHRLREAMRSGDLAPFGANGTPVEADETFIGREPGVPMPKGGVSHKMKVLSLLDRETARVRSVVIDNMRVDTIAGIVNANVAKEARLMTDEAYHYAAIGKSFATMALSGTRLTST